MFCRKIGKKGYITYNNMEYEMTIDEAMRSKDSGVELDVIVSPRSNRSGVEGVDEWRNRMVIRVKAPPLDGRANKEVEKVLSDMTGCKTTVISGHTNRQKTVFIEGDPKAIVQKLRACDE